MIFVDTHAIVDYWHGLSGLTTIRTAADVTVYGAVTDISRMESDASQ